jgi:protein TonB
MFEDSLLESGNRFKAGRRRAITVVSFIVEGLFIGILILIPLIYTEALPRQQLMTYLVAPPPPPPPPPPPAAAKVVKAVQSELINGRLRTPTHIPEKVQTIKEDVAPPSMASAGVIGGVVGGVNGGAVGGVLGGIIGSTPTVVPKVAAPQHLLKVSQGVLEGSLIHKVTPVYPLLARQARISGVVILQAVISKSGTIENLTLKQGNPMLAPAAIEAVRQWKYKPYYLNGEPVEVETLITLNFTLA